jgi:hypothetical protein
VLLLATKKQNPWPNYRGQSCSDPDDMAAAAFAHFDDLIGTDANRECTLNLDHLIEPSQDLAGSSD